MHFMHSFTGAEFSSWLCFFLAVPEDNSCATISEEIRPDMEQVREDLTEMKVQIGLLMVDMQATVRRQKLLKEENIELKAQLQMIMEGMIKESHQTPVVSTEANTALYPATDRVFSSSQPGSTLIYHGIHF